MDHKAHNEIPHEEEPLRISGYGSTLKLQFSKPLDPEEIKTIIAEFIKTVEELLTKSGAKGIGHIKLYIKGRSGYLRADTLGSKYGIHTDGYLSEQELSIQMTINTIALGIDKDGVASATRESIEITARRHNLMIMDEKSF